jgi:hypothetical protein
MGAMLISIEEQTPVDHKQVAVLRAHAGILMKFYVSNVGRKVIMRIIARIVINQGTEGASNG